MHKFKTGLVVGRFQPFHKGHLYLFNKALVYADRIIIAVGSSNVKNGENPLSYQDRVEMLEKVIEHEGLKEKVINIIPSPDHASDETWLKLLLSNTGEFDAEVGNNDWVNGILENAGYKVIKIPYYKRDLYQGVYIRELFRSGKNWKERVPSYLADFIGKKLSAAS